MTASKSQDKSGPESSHLLLYDGVCGLCNCLVQFVLAHDRRRVFDFASLQSPTGRAVTAHSGSAKMSTFYVIAGYQTPDSRLLAKGQAAVFVLRALGWPWKAGLILDLLPMRLLNWAYDAVARNRYRFFGRQDRCLLPRPEFRNRFVDF